MKKLLGVTLASVLMVMVLSVAAQEEAIPKDLPFTGKILMIYTQSAGAHMPLCISEYSVRELGGRKFLVGTIIDYMDGIPGVGKKQWISADDVVRVIEYDSEDVVRTDIEYAIDSMRNMLAKFRINRGGGDRKRPQGGDKAKP